MKNIKNFSVDELFKATRVFNTYCGAVDEMVRRLKHKVVPYVRIYGDYDHGNQYPHFRGGVDDQGFDPKSDNYTETTSAEVNGWMLTLKSRGDHIVRLKRELERRSKRLQTYEQMTHDQLKHITGLEKQVEELERQYQGPQFVRGGSSMRFTDGGPQCTDYIADRHSGKRVVEVHDDQPLRNRIVDLLNED